MARVVNDMKTHWPVARFDTELGVCAVRWSAIGITSVDLPSRLTRELPSPGEGIALPDFVRVAIDAMAAVLAGERRDLGDIPLDDGGIDPFRRQVYAATRSISPGTTATYGQIARAIGLPDAARDVGAALSRNPFPIVVPCHRVIAANGALTGFSAAGGLATKRRMLELEGAPGFGQQLLFG
jgi:methylated-DNA-[protein]-cysteine S-methyltransferase